MYSTRAKLLHNETTEAFSDYNNAIRSCIGKYIHTAMLSIKYYYNI